MFNKQTMYHKTPKGLEAVANRQSGLGPKLRSLLIMVDGKRSFTDLVALTGECEALLGELAQNGLIEPAAAAAPEATVPAPLDAASLSGAKHCATKLLIELLGPTSEVLCIKIESAGNLADFVSAVKRAREVVRDVKGATAAERFIAEIELHTPQA